MKNFDINYSEEIINKDIKEKISIGSLTGASYQISIIGI